MDIFTVCSRCLQLLRDSASPKTTPTRATFSGIKRKTVKIIAFGLILLLLIERVSGAPMRKKGVGGYRWHRPCGGSKPRRLSDVSKFTAKHTTSADTKKHFVNLRNSVQHVKHRASTLQEKYIKHRISDRKLIESCSEFRLNGMPEGKDTFTMNTKEKLQQTFLDLARVAVFLEQTKTDEVEYEHSKMHDDIRWVENGIYSLLCDLHIYIVSNGHVVTEEITRDVMSLKFRDIDKRSMRHLRDYIIMRDTVRYLGSLTKDFALMEYII